MSDVAPSTPVVSAAPVTNTPNSTATMQAAIDNIDPSTLEAAVSNEAPKDPKADAKAKEAANRKKKFNLKVDGRDEEMELDLDNEDEVRKHLQFSKVANKRMQESAEMRKGIEQLLDTLRTDPGKVLNDPRLQIPEEIRKKLAESIINEELQEMTKTPEQKEKERIQKEYERLKAQVEEEKKGREAAEMARLQEQQAGLLDTEISGAIQALGLPKNARTVRYMADALYFCMENGLDLSAKDIAPYVKKQTLSEFKEMVASLPDEEFEGWLGKDQISRIRKRSIQRAKAPTENPANIKSTGSEVNKAPADSGKKVLFKDFMKSLGK